MKSAFNEFMSKCEQLGITEEQFSKIREIWDDDEDLSSTFDVVLDESCDPDTSEVYVVSYRIALIINPSCLVFDSKDGIEYSYYYGELLITAHSKEEAIDKTQEFLLDDHPFECYTVDMIDAEPLRGIKRKCKYRINDKCILDNYGVNCDDCEVTIDEC